MRLGEATFFPNPAAISEDSKNHNGNLKDSLQSRILELEKELQHRQTELHLASDKIARLEQRLQDL